MREQGTIKWFNYGKGFGFIVPDKGGPEVFLYIGLCQRIGFNPKELMRVEYEAEPTEKGLKAVWVGAIGKGSIYKAIQDFPLSEIAKVPRDG